MPVRSLNSPVLVWPKRADVDRALRSWVETAADRHSALIRLGCFGSFARGDWGVGSDLDLVAIVAASDEPFERRALEWDLAPLPVPAELLIYTQEEWEHLPQQSPRFAATLERETLWIYTRR
jgi:uncharacterized protein